MSMAMKAHASIPPDVMARAVGEEIVILNLTNGAYFGLDAVGARVWTLIGESKSLSEICAAMLNEYDVPPDELERDIAKLVQDLFAQQLINLV